MHNVCDSAIQRYLRFVQWPRICNERKERDPICLCTNNYGLYWNGRTGRNRMDAAQLDATDWLVRLRLVVLNLSQAFKHILSCYGRAILNEAGTGKALVMKAQGRDVISQYFVFDL